MTGSATDSKAPIFDIQSFSVHDGPGIRTTVFFKGCPLNCIWCHNPESKASRPQLLFYKNRCSGCLSCITLCETGAQILLPDGTHGIAHEKCTLCGKCTEICCYEAVKICGQFFSPKELFERIKGDMRYFALETGTKTLPHEQGASGESAEQGGITFSGGEPLLYADFIKDFCSMIPDIHAAMETSGYGRIEDLEKIIDCIDLFLFDIKMMNNAEHYKLCGRKNDTILENLKFLHENKKDIILRLPLIPGINDTTEHFDGIAALIEKYPEIKKADILPYHNYGYAKAEGLGMEIPPELPSLNPGKEIIEKWRSEFRNRGLANIVLVG